MPKIKFIRDTGPFEGGPHEEGDVLDCNDASAQRWIKRNAAVIDDGKPEPEPEPVKPASKSIDAPPQDKAIKSPPKKK